MPAVNKPPLFCPLTFFIFLEDAFVVIAVSRGVVGGLLICGCFVVCCLFRFVGFLSVFFVVILFLFFLGLLVCLLSFFVVVVVLCVCVGGGGGELETPCQSAVSSCFSLVYSRVRVFSHPSSLTPTPAYPTQISVVNTGVFASR